MTTVRLPSSLRSYSRGSPEVSVRGATVREAIEDLERQCPGIRERLVDGAGSVRRYINLFLNEEDVRFLAGLETHLGEHDRLTIIPAVAGGA